GKGVAQLRVDGGIGQDAVLSPDGGMIATGARYGIAHIWMPPIHPRGSDSDDQDLVLRGHANGLSSIAFSPDGGLVVTASWDNTARVWEVRGLRDQLARLHSVGELLAAARARVGRNLTDQEKKLFLSD